MERGDFDLLIFHLAKACFQHHCLILCRERLCAAESAQHFWAKHSLSPVNRGKSLSGASSLETREGNRARAKMRKWRLSCKAVSTKKYSLLLSHLVFRSFSA